MQDKEKALDTTVADPQPEDQPGNQHVCTRPGWQFIRHLRI